MISLRELARQYSYDEATVRQWKLKGMPHGKDIPDEITRNWIVENIIKPLRDTNTREQIEKERLRDITASANIKELDEAERKGELINVAIVESELAKYFHQFKTIMRSIPSSEYLKLFESKDAITLKNNLQEVIDNALREIGSLELSGEEQIQEDLPTNNKKDTTSRKNKTK
jgi:phage terminase Nu1 subunit (DNA packaging protein)